MFFARSYYASRYFSPYLFTGDTQPGVYFAPGYFAGPYFARRYWPGAGATSGYPFAPQYFSPGYFASRYFPSGVVVDPAGESWFSADGVGGVEFDLVWNEPVSIAMPGVGGAEFTTAGLYMDGSGSAAFDARNGEPVTGFESGGVGGFTLYFALGAIEECITSDETPEVPLAICNYVF